MSNLDKTISITIENSDKILYEGKVKALSCVNDKGPFDILAYHANFISLIKDKVTIVDPSGAKKEFPIGKGVLKVFENTVSIFVGIN